MDSTQDLNDSLDDSSIESSIPNESSLYSETAGEGSSTDVSVLSNGTSVVTNRTITQNVLEPTRSSQRPQETAASAEESGDTSENSIDIQDEFPEINQLQNLHEIFETCALSSSEIDNLLQKLHDSLNKDRLKINELEVTYQRQLKFVKMFEAARKAAEDAQMKSAEQDDLSTAEELETNTADPIAEKASPNDEAAAIPKKRNAKDEAGPAPKKIHPKDGEASAVPKKRNATDKKEHSSDEEVRPKKRNSKKKRAPPAPNNAFPDAGAAGPAPINANPEAEAAGPAPNSAIPEAEAAGPAPNSAIPEAEAAAGPAPTMDNSTNTEITPVFEVPLTNRREDLPFTPSSNNIQMFQTHPVEIAPFNPYFTTIIPGPAHSSFDIEVNMHTSVRAIVRDPPLVVLGNRQSAIIHCFISSIRFYVEEISSDSFPGRAPRPTEPPSESP